MITVGLSSHLGPWPMPTCLALLTQHTWYCQQSGYCPSSPRREADELFLLQCSHSWRLQEIPCEPAGFPLTTRSPPTPRMVHNVQPMPIGRRVTQISDRSTTVCGVKMPRSTRDDLGTRQSSHTNIPGYSRPGDIFYYNFIVHLSFSSNIALFLWDFLTHILLLEELLNF